ncbi:MAG: STAS/SEC14 domain-containing protein [Gammaproteobacteria bacterium]
MSYTISISDSRKFLRVRIEGDTSAASAREWSAELREVSRTQGIRRLLVDVRSSRNVSTVLENYQYAYRSTRDLAWEKTVRSAILASPEDRSHDMIETFMRNACFNVRIFTDESAAIAWLEDDAR